MNGFKTADYDFKPTVDVLGMYAPGGNLYNNTDTTSWLNNDNLKLGFQGLQALSGLANAYTGFKNFQLAQDAFNYQKAYANRNLANQAKIINNTYDNAAQVAAGMLGGKDAQGNYGFTSQEVIDKYANKAKDKHVSGTI